MTPLIALLFGAAAPQASSMPVEEAVPRSFTVNLTIPPAAEQAPAAIEIVQGHILFQAKMMGRDAWMLLDNRAVPSVIDTAFAQTAGLRVESREGTIKTAHGTVPKRLVRGVTLSVPGVIDVRAGGMAAVDLTPFSRAIGRKIDGLFGGDYLGQLALLMQTSKGRFRLAKSGAVKMPPMYPLVPLLDARPKLALQVGEATVTVTLDLGDNGMLTLTPEAWKRVAPKDATLSQAMSMGADGQPYIGNSGSLPAVTLGRFTRKDVRVAVLPDAGGENGEGRIGVGFLADCDFLLDIKAGGLWVIPRVRSDRAKPE